MTARTMFIALPAGEAHLDAEQTSRGLWNIYHPYLGYLGLVTENHTQFTIRHADPFTTLGDAARELWERWYR